MSKISRNFKSALCLACGFCCDGTLFRDVKLRPEDSPERLSQLGLVLLCADRSPVSTAAPGVADAPRRWKFRQPCAALEGCRCRVYAERPRYCREFECRLLQRLTTGAVGLRAALSRVQRTRRKVDAAQSLLAALGDTRGHVHLGARFRALRNRLERSEPDRAAAHRFAELTLIMHELSLDLARYFYPGAPRA